MNNPSLSEAAIHAQEAERSDRRKSNIATIVTFIIIMAILLFPFFNTIFPIPEAEGLQVAFGDVPIAGGGGEPNPNPTPTPNPTPNPTPPVNDKTDITTVDDNKDPDITKPDKPTPTPPTPPNPNTNTNTNTNNSNTNSTDPNTLFGGGSGPNKGPGKQGDPNGKKDLGGTGRGDQGNGDGKVGNRAIQQKCTSVMSSTNWEETGTAWVFICVDENGKVLEANFQAKTALGEVSSITSTNQHRIAERCAKEYKYEPAPGQGTACGSIPITFKKQ